MSKKNQTAPRVDVIEAVTAQTAEMQQTAAAVDAMLNPVAAIETAVAVQTVEVAAIETAAKQIETAAAEIITANAIKVEEMKVQAEMLVINYPALIQAAMIADDWDEVARLTAEKKKAFVMDKAAMWTNLEADATKLLGSDDWKAIIKRYNEMADRDKLSANQMALIIIPTDGKGWKVLAKRMGDTVGAASAEIKEKKTPRAAGEKGSSKVDHWIIIKDGGVEIGRTTSGTKAAAILGAKSTSGNAFWGEMKGKDMTTEGKDRYDIKYNGAECSLVRIK